MADLVVGVNGELFETLVLGDCVREQVCRGKRGLIAGEISWMPIQGSGDEMEACLLMVESWYICMKIYVCVIDETVMLGEVRRQ